MTKSFLTIALAVATMPLMFAKSQAPVPAATGSTSKPAVTTTAPKATTSVKKHHKKANSKKVAPKTDGSSVPAAAKPSK